MLFQSTLPRGERPNSWLEKIYQLLISIHAPARGATGNTDIRHPTDQNFNPRSREGSDFLRVPANMTGKQISIHAPARGATLTLWLALRAVVKFQSTLPRGERHYEEIFPLCVKRISIHAPARGATSSVRPFCLSQIISIHAPARGATAPQRLCKSSGTISIHAPARGATKKQKLFRRSLRYFNPRSREGSDAAQDGFDLGEAIFQSTLPRGERRFLLPRLHSTLLISIHAPARGATVLRYKRPPYLRYFNPRSREGSDNCLRIRGRLL